MELWESHRVLLGSFASSSLSEWTLDLETWDNTAEAEEEEFINHRSDPDNKSTYAMVLDAPSPEEVGKEDGLEVYKKVWGAVASQLSITMPYTFRLGAFLEYLSLKQDISVERLQKLCSDVAS